MHLLKNASGKRHSPQLVATLMVDDAMGFRQLHDMARPYLLAFAMRIIRNRHLAEEVIQESFALIWSAMALYDSRLSAPMTWMIAIVRNKSFDCLRRETEHGAKAIHDDWVLDDAPDPGATPDEKYERQQLVDEIKRAIASLTGAQRQAVHLVYCHDLSYPEAATVLLQPLSTVKTLVRRAMFKIRTEMGQNPAALDAPKSAPLEPAAQTTRCAPTRIRAPAPLQKCPARLVPRLASARIWRRSADRSMTTTPPGDSDGLCWHNGGHSAMVRYQRQC